jgi:signal transduction histidine kinase/pSer/pThr/pTyr-binding forkhead associated (FHA) protein
MKITVFSEGESERAFEFEGTADVVVGRDDACSISLADPKVSRRHARFFSRNNCVLVEDLGSANGIRVNGLKVQELALEEGDKISLGGTVLVIFGIPRARPGQQANRMVRVSKSQTVVLSLLPHDRAGVVADAAKPDELEALREDRRSLRVIHEISQVLAGQLRFEECLHSIVGILREFCEADTACVLERGQEGEEWAVRAFTTLTAPDAQMQISETIIQRSVDEGVAILCRDPLTDERFQRSHSMMVEGVTSAICSPMRFDGGFNGVLFLDRRNRQDVFTEKEMRLATTVASIVGLLLDKARMDQAARQRERLAVIGEVVSNLAHYAGTVISGMDLGLSTLRMAMDRRDYERVPEYVRAFELQNNRLSELVLNMLSYSRDQVPICERVRISRVIEEVVGPLRDGLAATGVSLVVDCRPPEVEIWAEESSVRRVLLNLLMNSVAAVQGPTRGAKEIRISVEPRDKGWVQIRFRDTGMGIAPDNLDKVFDIFVSSKGDKGTGLGLAVVKKVIAEHGGEVQVASEPGAWTEFSILLPAPQGA